MVIPLLISIAMLSSCSTTSGPATAPNGGAISAGPPPSEAQRLWRLSEEQQRAGNLPSSISTLERIAQTYPDNLIAAKALYKLGHIYLKQGRTEKALQFFDYLIYMYPRWEDINLAKLDRFRALAETGKQKEVTKEALEVWNTSSGEPEVQVGLSRLMAEIYMSQGDREAAFEWASSGFRYVNSPQDKNDFTKLTLAILKDADESAIRKMAKKKPNDFMRVFLEFRQAQIDMEKGKSEGAQERLRTLLSQNAMHPIAPEIQAALRGLPARAPAAASPAMASPALGPSNQASALPLNADRLGCMLPLNGPYGKYGQMVMRGLGLANDEWSEMHPDQHVKLVVRDAQNDPDLAIRSFNELTKKEGALAIIGPLGSQAAKAVAPMADQSNVPLLALTQKEEDSPDSAYTLHVFLDNRELVRTLVKHCREKLGFTRFAALYPDDRYGQKLSKIFAEVVKEEGGNLLASIPYKEKSTDFKEPIQKLMTVAKQNVPPSGVDTTPFEALFIPDQVQTVSLIAPQLPYYNVIGTTLLGTNLWGEGPLVQVGGSYVEQAIFSTPYYAESQSSRVRAFREKYQAVYHVQPSYLEAQAYDAMMLFLQARSTLPPGAMDRTSLLQSLLQTRGYQGVTGNYSFSPNGELKRNYLLYQVLNGQLTQVSP